MTEANNNFFLQTTATQTERKKLTK